MDSILSRCMRELNKEQDIKQLKSYPAFGLLLIMQWTFAYGRLPDEGKPDISNGGFCHLVNLWHNLPTAGIIPENAKQLRLFMRNTVFQQFWLQGRLIKADYIRQYILFRHSDPRHYFNMLFRETYGIEMSDFLDLCLPISIFALGIEEPPILSKSWYYPLKKHYPSGTIERFYELVSGDRHELRKIAIDASKGSIANQIYRRTPFRHRPFYRLPNGDCHLLSNPVLGYYINNAVYDMLRTPDPHKFMISFGKIFEKYVFERLDEAKLQYWSKSQIQKVCSGLNVDAIIEDESSLVYLDAKGVEMATLGMLPSAPPRVITDKLKKSVLKGIEQGYDSNRSVKSSSPELSDKEAFLVIVTYKEFFLGSGTTFEYSLGADFLTKLNSKTKPEYQIPSENMFFLDIRELEKLVCIIKSGKHSLLEMLLYARKENRDPNTEKMMFSMHLDNFQDTAEQLSLNEVFDKESERLVNMLRSR